MAEWVRALDERPSGPSNPAATTSLRNFGNSVYPLCQLVSFGGDTKSRLSLLSGVYARGSKRSHHGISLH